MNDDPITLRRQMDDTLRQHIESDRERIQAISERLNRVEIVLETISERFEDHESTASEIQNKLINIAEKMTVLSAHFSDHILREEEQWGIVNNSANVLKEVTQQLKITEHRVSGLDRLVWALIGFTLSGFGAAVVWVIQHLESMLK